jgi:flagellar motor protein MotB
MCKVSVWGILVVVLSLVGCHDVRQCPDGRPVVIGGCQETFVSTASGIVGDIKGNADAIKQTVGGSLSVKYLSIQQKLDDYTHRALNAIQTACSVVDHDPCDKALGRTYMKNFNAILASLKDVKNKTEAVVQSASGSNPSPEVVEDKLDVLEESIDDGGGLVIDGKSKELGKNSILALGPVSIECYSGNPLENAGKSSGGNVPGFEPLISELRDALGINQVLFSLSEPSVYLKPPVIVTFRSGSEDVENDDRARLHKIAIVLAKHREAQVRIEGHADIVPVSGLKYKSNWDLSYARANRVRRILQESGIDDERIYLVAYSNNSPIVSNTSKTAMAKNRRIEILLYLTEKPATPA